MSTSLSTVAVPIDAVTFSNCLKVQIPVTSTIEQVSGVALGVSAAVSLVVGALVAVLVAWLFFRKQDNKVDEKTSDIAHENAARTLNGRRKSDGAGHVNRGADDDAEHDIKADVGDPKPLIMQSFAADDRTRHGMLDILGLTAESDILVEISRQDLESVSRMELFLRESRINVIMLLVCAVLNQLLSVKRIRPSDAKVFLSNACNVARQTISSSQMTLKSEVEALKKKLKNADVLDLEIRSLQQKFAFRMNFELVQDVKERLRRDLSKAFELSEDEIDVAMRNMTDALTRLDTAMVSETSKNVVYLEEMRVQRTGFIHMLLADHYDKPSEVDNRNRALRTVLDSHKTEGKLTDKVHQSIAQQYAVDLKALLDKVNLELRTQTTGAVVKLHESRQEKFTILYQKQEKQWVEFFSSAKKVSKLKEITEAFLELVNSMRSDQDNLGEGLDQKEAKMLNAVKQGLDETWQQEVNAIDERMRETLRTKAQLSDRELEKTNRQFLQELQQLQKMRHIEKRDFIQSMQASLNEGQQLAQQAQLTERGDQQALHDTRDVLLGTVLKMQIGLTEEARKTITKDHDEIMAVILSQLRVNCLYWNKVRDYHLIQKRKQLTDSKRKLNELSAEGNTGKKDAKSKQKQIQQLEKQVADEELKLLKVKAEEDAFVRAQIESQTTDAMNMHDKQLALVIGRLLTRQARKQATPTACLDPTIAKLEDDLLKFIEASDVRVSLATLDSILQQYENEIGVLMSQLSGARERQLRVLMEKLDHRHLQRQRELQTKLQAEAAKEWKLQRRQSNSALLTELSRCFFEQQYQRALADLVGETSIEKERAKEELYNDLDVELQKQLKERRTALCASLMAVAKLNNDDIASLVTTAVREVGGDDQRAAKLIRELRLEVQRSKTERDLDRPQSTSSKQQRWPKTDEDYTSRNSSLSSAAATRPPSRLSSYGDRGGYEGSTAERPRSGHHASIDHGSQRLPPMQRSKNEDDYLARQRPSAVSEYAGADRLQRSRTDMADTRGVRSAAPSLERQRYGKTDYSGKDTWKYGNSDKSDDDDDDDDNNNDDDDDDDEGKYSDVPSPVHRPSTSMGGLNRPRSAMMRSKEI